MKLSELRVRNYRTISNEQTLRLANGTTLVGPNNSGKTNLLRAVQLFFTGYDNVFGYKRDTDLTFGAGSQKTSLVATFEGNDHPKDDELFSLLDELHEIVGTKREGKTFSVNLYFTGENDTPVYRVFPNAKVSHERDRPNYSRKQKQLVETLLAMFRCHFVPSAKSISGLYEDLLQPFLAEIAYHAMEPHIEKLREALKDVSDSLDAQLKAVGLSHFSADFTLRGESATQMLSGFDLMLSDPDRTPIWEKGLGVQSTALFASFAWITQQEKESGFESIWLIEEPESYLHPELSSSCKEILEDLSKSALLLISTHSLTFIPLDTERIHGVDRDAHGRTVVSQYLTHAQAAARIRDSLGVQFSDYYSLGSTNVFVEGESDARLIHWAYSLLDPEAHRYPCIAASLIEYFGGAKQLEGFLRGVYHLISPERALVAVFDGDDAGLRSVRALQQYFGQKGLQFQPNREYVSVRRGFAIEGLFPDPWIIEIYNDHPSWFEDFSVDSTDQLEFFRARDENKKSLTNQLVGRAEESDDDAWAHRWIAFLDTIENSLARQNTSIASSTSKKALAM